MQTCFLMKNFQNFLFMFSFYWINSRTNPRKNSIFQEWLVLKSCATPRRITLLIFCRLVYYTPSHLNDLALAWTALLRFCQKIMRENSRLAYEIYRFLKQGVSATQFLDLLIVIDLLLSNWKKGREQLGMHFLNQLAFQRVQKVPFSLGWSKINTLSIASGVTSTLNFF